MPLQSCGQFIEFSFPIPPSHLPSPQTIGQSCRQVFPFSVTKRLDIESYTLFSHVPFPQWQSPKQLVEFSPLLVSQILFPQTKLKPPLLDELLLELELELDPPLELLEDDELELLLTTEVQSGYGFKATNVFIETQELFKHV
jgi:hypothetical protein